MSRGTPSAPQTLVSCRTNRRQQGPSERNLAACDDCWLSHKAANLSGCTASRVVRSTSLCQLTRTRSPQNLGKQNLGWRRRAPTGTAHHFMAVSRPRSRISVRAKQRTCPWPVQPRAQAVHRSQSDLIRYDEHRFKLAQHWQCCTRQDSAGDCLGKAGQNLSGEMTV